MTILGLTSWLRKLRGVPVNVNAKVRHRGKPGEPFAQFGQHGVVSRVTPASKNIPAMAYVLWADEKHGEYATWERQSDLILPQ